MASSIVRILLSSVVGWFYVYGAWLFFSEILYYTIPVSAIGALILFILINFLRIPPPDSFVVQEILGDEPCLCSVDVQDEIQNNDPDKGDVSNDKYVMKTVAHRGAGLDAPENSMTAIRKTKERGCTAIEVDVALTSDNVPILFHDACVDRITEATGQIHEMTWDQVKELDISSKHPFRDKFAGEKVAPLECAIKECLKLGLRIFLDLKGDDLKMVPIILELYKTFEELHTRAVVSSFNPVLIYSIRRANPRIVCSLAWRPHFFTSVSYSGALGEGRPRHKSMPLHLVSRLGDVVSKWALGNITYYLLGLSAILLHKDVVTAEVVDQWRQRGIRVIPWTVNLPSEKQYFSRVLKVTYMTDTLETNIG